MPADKSEKIDSSDMMDTHRLRGLEGGGVEGLRYFCTATNWMFCFVLFRDYFFRILFFWDQHTTWNWKDWKQTFRFLLKVHSV